jgi:hypothetical protein
VGLVGGPGAKVEAVSVVGQKRAGMRVSMGLVELFDVTFIATSRGASALLVEDGRARVRRARVFGPFRRGVELRAGTLHLHSVLVEGAETALHQRGGRASLEGCRVQAGSGPGLFVAGGSLTVRRTLVEGHEYGLQSSGGATVHARGFVSVRAERAGIALVQTKAQLEDGLVLQAGSFGGVQLVSSEVEGSELWILRPHSHGLSARSTRLELRQVEVTGARGTEGDGDGLHFRGGTAELSGIRVRDPEGVGLLVSEGAKVRVRGAMVERPWVAGVLVETLGTLDAERLLIRGAHSLAVAVLGAGTASLSQVTIEDPRGPAVWADCARGASLSWKGPPPPVSKDGPLPPCVRLSGGAGVE